MKLMAASEVSLPLFGPRRVIVRNAEHPFRIRSTKPLEGVLVSHAVAALLHKEEISIEEILSIEDRTDLGLIELTVRQISIEAQKYLRWFISREEMTSLLDLYGLAGYPELEFNAHPEQLSFSAQGTNGIIINPFECAPKSWLDSFLEWLAAQGPRPDPSIFSWQIYGNHLFIPFNPSVTDANGNGMSEPLTAALIEDAADGNSYRTVAILSELLDGTVPPLPTLLQRKGTLVYRYKQIRNAPACRVVLDEEEADGNFDSDMFLRLFAEPQEIRECKRSILVNGPTTTHKFKHFCLKSPWGSIILAATKRFPLNENRYWIEAMRNGGKITLSLFVPGDEEERARVIIDIDSLLGREATVYQLQPFLICPSLIYDKSDFIRLFAADSQTGRLTFSLYPEFDDRYKSGAFVLDSPLSIPIVLINPLRPALVNAPYTLEAVRRHNTLTISISTEGGNPIGSVTIELYKNRRLSYLIPGSSHLEQGKEAGKIFRFFIKLANPPAHKKIL